MKFNINIEDTVKGFKVNIFDMNLALIYSCGWQGGEFKYQNKWYAVIGPYHSLINDDKFQVFELVPVSERK